MWWAAWGALELLALCGSCEGGPERADAEFWGWPPEPAATEAYDVLRYMARREPAGTGAARCRSEKEARQGRVKGSQTGSRNVEAASQQAGVSPCRVSGDVQVPFSERDPQFQLLYLPV